MDQDGDPRESEPGGTDERSILADDLRRYRLTLEMKCADLDGAQPDDDVIREAWAA